MAYNYLGYGVTDENGVAKLDHDANGDPLTHSYTGVGAGEVDVVASLDNPVSSGSIVSEIFVVTDATYYDNMASDTNTNYYFNGADGTSIAYDSSLQALKMTCGSDNSRNYVDLRTSNPALDINTVKGKSVRFEVDVEGLNGKGYRLRIVINAGTTLAQTDYITSDGKQSIDAIIPSDVTFVVFQIAPRNTTEWSQGSTYYFKDFTIYQI